MAEILAAFQTHEQQRQELESLIARAESALQALSFGIERESTAALLARVRSDAFRVLVIGEFKRGKSTLINAMLGQEVLPAFAVPCTAVINEICWGEERSARVHFRPSLPEESLRDLSPSAMAHIAAHPGVELIPPLDIDVDLLEEFVAIGDPARDHARSVAESPYERVVIRWPLELCRNNVRIIDSPGLNEHLSRSRITTEYLPQSDAIVFVFSCHAIASHSEIAVIEDRIRAAGYEEIFFIVNRMDEIRDRDRDRVVAYAIERLAPLTSFGTNGVFFLSAREALEGIERGEDERLHGSGLPDFLVELERFLVHDRGRVKLLQPLRDVLRRIRTVLEEGIPARRAMFRLDVEELRRRLEDAKPSLAEAKHLKQQILDRAKVHRMEMKDEVARAARRHLERQADAIHPWLEACTPENEFDFLRGRSTKLQLKRLAEELGAFVAGHLEHENAQWQRDELQPLIQSRIAEMVDDVEVPVGEFLEGLDTTMADLTGVARRATTEAETPPLERVLAAAGGLLIGGFGSAYVGGTMGLREMLYSLVPQFGLFVGMMVMGIANPLVIIGVLLGSGVLQGVLRQASITDQIKRKAAAHLARSLKENAPSIIDQTAQRLDEHCLTIIGSLEQGMSNELRSREGEVEHVLAELDAGQARVAAAERELDQQEQDLRHIRDEAEDLLLAIR